MRSLARVVAIRLAVKSAAVYGANNWSGVVFYAPVPDGELVIFFQIGVSGSATTRLLA